MSTVQQGIDVLKMLDSQRALDQGTPQFKRGDVVTIDHGYGSIPARIIRIHIDTFVRYDLEAARFMDDGWTLVRMYNIGEAFISLA